MWTFTSCLTSKSVFLHRVFLCLNRAAIMPLQFPKSRLRVCWQMLSSVLFLPKAPISLQVNILVSPVSTSTGYTLHSILFFIIIIKGELLCLFNQIGQVYELYNTCPWSSLYKIIFTSILQRLFLSSFIWATSLISCCRKSSNCCLYILAKFNWSENGRKTFLNTH